MSKDEVRRNCRFVKGVGARVAKRTVTRNRGQAIVRNACPGRCKWQWLTLAWNSWPGRRGVQTLAVDPDTLDLTQPGAFSAKTLVETRVPSPDKRRRFKMYLQQTQKKKRQALSRRAFIFFFKLRHWRRVMLCDMMSIIHYNGLSGDCSWMKCCFFCSRTLLCSERSRFIGTDKILKTVNKGKEILGLPNPWHLSLLHIEVM